jgi:DNA polymerase III alpha subunit (gram-positive type)
LQAHSGQQALSRFVAKASVKIDALRTTGRDAKAIAIIPADYSIEEFLPLHVLLIAER